MIPGTAARGLAARCATYLSSVAGERLGYAIGYFLFDTAGRPLTVIRKQPRCAK